MLLSKEELENKSDGERLRELGLCSLGKRRLRGGPCWIMQSPTVEKTSKVIKSKHRPNPTTPAKPCPEVPCLHVF